MSADLLLHGRQIDSVFELLGLKENDITYSLGWALANSPNLCDALLSQLFPGVHDRSVTAIELQSYAADDGGFTDVDIRGPHLHVIIEAKRGWTLPTNAQLRRYAPRLDSKTAQAAIVVMSECSPVYAKRHLPEQIDDVPLTHISWAEVQQLALVGCQCHAEKRLLAELRTYLQKVVKMQNQQSNMVYIVALSSATADGAELSWIDVVEKRGKYFHPMGTKTKRWPKEPPNYIGFRYHGRLQSIHHVEKVEVVDDLMNDLPEIGITFDVPHFLYTLGPAIRPPKNVTTGRVYPSGRVWAMLDLLLTSDTIAEARDRTRQRQTPAS